MFHKMYLILEENKLRKRFGGTVTEALLQVVDKEVNERFQEEIYRKLLKFNEVIKFVDKIMYSIIGDDGWKVYEEEFHDQYINILLNEMNKIYYLFGITDYLQQFSHNYWKQTQKYILQLWKEMPKGKSVTSNEASFIKIFEDFFSESMKIFPEFVVRPLKEFKSLYRASQYEVYDNYKYIIPDSAYCYDNRWNDDGVAFLYLSYDNEDRDYYNMKIAQKTCFEEIRAKERKELLVCKFRVLHGRRKILDLSYDGIDYEEYIRKLEVPDGDYKQRILKAISRNTKLCNKLGAYAKNDNKIAFQQELEKLEKDMGMDKEIRNYAQLQISKILIGNICDAIFYAVDKEDDPQLEAYIPFRVFSRYLIAKGFGGVAYRSTRMDKIGLQGKCLTLFNKNDASYIAGEMEVYKYTQGTCKLITRY